METITRVDEMAAWSRGHRRSGKTIGLVPTMGYLHEGHLSLMRLAASENDVVVVSIFVNPTQFGPSEDLDRYPRDPEGDARKCDQVGVDVIFAPNAPSIYGPNFQTYVEPGRVALPLCGASRPGHFRGVATVCLKLFNIVGATRAYFGEKDYQQLQVIKAMVSDFDMDLEIVGCPIVREEDGLAMSSRNAYLSPDERRQALCLHEALQEAQELALLGETCAAEYVQAMQQRIRKEPDATIDYVSLVHPATLEDINEVNDSALAVLAVHVGKTRLIDNMVLYRLPKTPAKTPADSLDHCLSQSVCVRKSPWQ